MMQRHNKTILRVVFSLLAVMMVVAMVAAQWPTGRRGGVIDVSAKVLRPEVVRYLENGSVIRERVTLDQSDTLFYVDAWESHWCEYYNDRAYFLTPRINEMLHLARSRGFMAFHLNWKEHKDKIDSVLRATARKRAADGFVQAVHDIWPDNTVNNSRYIPGFKDKCMLSNYTNFGPTRSQKPNPTIAVAQSDAIAFNFKSIANVAHALRAKTVVLMGMHTNLCILSAAMYLHLVNISVIYVNDMLDAGFYYPGQAKHGIRSHSQMNERTYNYSITIHGSGVETVDLMDGLLAMPAIVREPVWTMYGSVAVPFKRYYARN